jgi:hypothetical protein
VTRAAPCSAPSEDVSGVQEHMSKARRFRKRTAAWDYGDFACDLPVGSIRVDLTAVGQ